MTLGNPGRGPGLELGPPAGFGTGSNGDAVGPEERGLRLTLSLPELVAAWQAGRFAFVEVEGWEGIGLGGESRWEEPGLRGVALKGPGQLQLEWGPGRTEAGPQPLDWEEAFAAFHARFAPFFARSEPRAQAGKYLRGLLARVERKNG